MSSLLPRLRKLGDIPGSSFSNTTAVCFGFLFWRTQNNSAFLLFLCFCTSGVARNSWKTSVQRRRKAGEKPRASSQGQLQRHRYWKAFMRVEGRTYFEGKRHVRVNQEFLCFRDR